MVSFAIRQLADTDKYGSTENSLCIGNNYTDRPKGLAYACRLIVIQAGVQFYLASFYLSNESQLHRGLQTEKTLKWFYLIFMECSLSIEKEFTIDKCDGTINCNLKF